MSRLISMSVLAVLSFSLAGCHFLHAPPQVPVADYPARYNRPDLKIGWRTARTDSGISVQTILTNVQHSSVSDLRLEGSLWQGGKMVSKKSLPFKNTIGKGEYAKFTVTLKGAPLSSEDRVYFRIRYNAMEETTATTHTIEFAIDPNTDDVYEDQPAPEQRRG